MLLFISELKYSNYRIKGRLGLGWGVIISVRDEGMARVRVGMGCYSWFLGERNDQGQGGMGCYNWCSGLGLGWGGVIIGVRVKGMSGLGWGVIISVGVKGMSGLGWGVIISVRAKGMVRVRFGGVL